MRQAKYRKVLWVILLAELALLHVGVLLRLYVLRWEYPQVRLKASGKHGQPGKIHRPRLHSRIRGHL